MIRLLINVLIAVTVVASVAAATRLAYVEYHDNWLMFALAALVVFGWATVAALVAANRNSN